MGRRQRIHYPGAIYHVMARGVDRRNVYVDENDRLKFLAELERICSEASAKVIAYCLMGNHFHLAIQVADIPLSAIMHRLLTSYAGYFNLRFERTGHLFERRYEAKLCVDDSYLQRIIRYIHQNPVRANFVEKAREWRWSSVHAFADDGSNDDFEGFDPWDDDAAPVAIKRGLPESRRELTDICECVVHRTGVPAALIRSECRLRWVISARRMFVRDAVMGGHSLTSIANWLNTTRSSMTRYLAKIAECSKVKRPSSPVRRAGSGSA